MPGLRPVCRLEIPVGVTYGTDPGTVVNILVQGATKHPKVGGDPKPRALFLDFGDSSLDFELRAWTGANEQARVSSEKRVDTAQALRQAAIEIPFPQRDIHLRSSGDTVTLQASREANDLE